MLNNTGWNQLYVLTAREHIPNPRSSLRNKVYVVKMRGRTGSMQGAIPIGDKGRSYRDVIDAEYRK